MTDGKKLTKEELEEKRKANRFKQTITILKYETLKSMEFWSQVEDLNLFFDTFEAMKTIKKDLRTEVANRKLDELKLLGLEIPKNFSLKFSSD